jgi:hypothetical protein
MEQLTPGVRVVEYDLSTIIPPLEDDNVEPWFAPAGITRGRMGDVFDAGVVYTPYVPLMINDEIEWLYDENVRPIRTDGRPIEIWGQRVMGEPKFKTEGDRYRYRLGI